MNINAILFDLFITLLKPHRLISEGFIDATIQVLRRREINFDEERIHRALTESYVSGRKLKYDLGIEIHALRWIADSCYKSGLRLDFSTLKEIQKRAHEITIKSTEIFNDVIPTLDALYKAGYKMGLVSNISDDMLARVLLKEFKLSKYFSLVVTSADINIRKPDPRIFKYAAEHLEVPISQSMYVGDSMRDDIYGAKRAGMVTVRIIRRGVKENIYYVGKIYEDYKEVLPDYTINSLTELIDILNANKKQDDLK